MNLNKQLDAMYESDPEPPSWCWDCQHGGDRHDMDDWCTVCITCDKVHDINESRGDLKHILVCEYCDYEYETDDVLGHGELESDSNVEPNKEEQVKKLLRVIKCENCKTGNSLKIHNICDCVNGAIDGLVKEYVNGHLVAHIQGHRD